jgi:hypothetical protein
VRAAPGQPWLGTKAVAWRGYDDSSAYPRPRRSFVCVCLSLGCATRLSSSAATFRVSIGAVADRFATNTFGSSCLHPQARPTSAEPALHLCKALESHPGRGLRSIGGMRAPMPLSTNDRAN